MDQKTNYENTYSGISYCIDENNGVPYANKIITLNGSDYYLIDAHRIDWNKSYLTYTNSGSINYDFITNFFEDGGTGKRQRYSNMPSVDDTFTEWPSWYKEQSYVNSTGDVLDIVDYLAYITSYAISSINNIYESLNADTPLLKYDTVQIEKNNGKVDADYNIRSFPLVITLKPNQNNEQYVSDKIIKRYYDSIESRNIQLDLYVYDKDGIRISDPEIYNRSDRTGVALQYVAPENVGFAVDATFETSSIQGINPGKFITLFTFDGWEANDTLRAKKINYSIIRNKDNYEYDNYRLITFSCNTPQIVPKYKQSEKRILTISVKKTENTFSNIFINNIRYIYIPENFFTGSVLDKLSIYEDLVESSTSSGIQISKYVLESYLLKYDLITDKSKINFTDKKDEFILYIQANGLDNYLIPVTNYISMDYDRDGKRIGINFANEVDINVEIYPEFYGSPDQMQENNCIYPGNYDELSGESDYIYNGDGSKKTIEELYNNSDLNSFMVPLYHFARIANVNDYKSANQNIYEKNSTFAEGNDWGQSVNYCTNCERTFDNAKHYGFKFSFSTNISKTTVSEIMQKNQNNQLTNNPLIGYVDVCVGTTATKFVAANFIKLRFIVTNSSQVFFIDNTKIYEIPDVEFVETKYEVVNKEWENTSKLLNQWAESSLGKVKENPLYILGDSEKETESTAMLLTESNIYRSEEQYYWDLSLPIFRYNSWNENKGESFSDLEERIYPNLLGRSAQLSLPIGSVDLTKIEDSDKSKYLPLPDNDKFSYVSGLPKIIIGDDYEVTKTESDSLKKYNSLKNQILMTPILTKQSVYRDQNTTIRYQSHVRIGYKLFIDFDKTYKLNENGFLKYCSSSFISEIKGNASDTDENRGKRLCAKYVILNGDSDLNNNTYKYLIFLQPTIPDNIQRGLITSNDFSGEWEDFVMIDENKDNRFKLVLKIAENSTGSGTDINHDEASIIIKLNVMRAKNKFAGWANKITEYNGTTDIRILNINEIDGQEIRKNEIVTMDKFTPAGVQTVQTRNNNNIEIVSGDLIDKSKNIRRIRLDDPLENLFGYKKDIYVYLKQDNVKFGIYSDESCTVANIKPIPDNEIVKYTIDDVGRIDLSMTVNGNDWFRGYYNRVGKSDDYRNIEVQISRKDMYFFNITDNVISTIGVNMYNGTIKDLKINGLIPLAIPGLYSDQISGIYYDGTNSKFEVSLTDLKNSSNKFTITDFIDISRNFVDDSLAKLFGEDWVKYLKVSLTCSITNNGVFHEHYNIFEQQLKDVNAKIFRTIITEDTTIDATDYANRWKFVSTGYANKVYKKDGNVSFFEDESLIKTVINGKDSKVYLDINKLSNMVSVGDSIGIILCLMMPMVRNYRGKIYMFNLRFNVIS